MCVRTAMFHSSSSGETQPKYLRLGRVNCSLMQMELRVGVDVVVVVEEMECRGRLAGV